MQLSQPASDPRISLVSGFLSVTFLPITYTIYTLIIHINGKELIERKTLRKVSTTPHLMRESYSFLERNLCSLFSFPLQLIYPLKGDLYPNTTHAYLECWECFWSLGSIGRCQGWWMQYGAYCGIRKVREDTVRLNLVGARSLEGLGASGKLGLEGLFLFMYTNFIF